MQMFSQHDLDLFDLDARPDPGQSGVYVAISGNTAAGKSTLIRRVAERARALGHPAIGISERSFHHPLLTRMFSNPRRYAFAIQLNFMLQRHLVLLHQMELGRIVVIERSHFDDELFLREHLEAGNVSAEDAAAYEHLARALHAHLPAPHVLALMNPPPELSLERLRHAETVGERPSEFPNEDAKTNWVYRWHERYERLHSDFKERRQEDPIFAHTNVIILDSRADVGENTAILLDAVLTHVSPATNTRAGEHRGIGP